MPAAVSIGGAARKDGDSDGRVSDARGRDVVPIGVRPAGGGTGDNADLRERIAEMKAAPKPTTPEEAAAFREKARELKAEAVATKAAPAQGGDRKALAEEVDAVARERNVDLATKGGVQEVLGTSDKVIAKATAPPAGTGDAALPAVKDSIGLIERTNQFARSDSLGLVESGFGSKPEIVAAARQRSAEIQDAGTKSFGRSVDAVREGLPKVPPAPASFDALKSAIVVDPAGMPESVRGSMTRFADDVGGRLDVPGGLTVIRPTGTARRVVNAARKSADDGSPTPTWGPTLRERLSAEPDSVWSAVSVATVKVGNREYKRLAPDAWLRSDDGDIQLVGADRVPETAGGTRRAKK